MPFTSPLSFLRLSYTQADLRRLRWEDLPVNGAPIWFSDTRRTAGGEIARPFAERHSSRTDSRTFSMFLGTAARIPAPPTVRVEPENIMSDRKQFGIWRCSDAKPASANYPYSHSTLSSAVLGRGGPEKFSMCKAGGEPSQGSCFLALPESDLTEYPLSALKAQSRRSCESCLPTSSGQSSFDLRKR